ncbi:ABC transporter permease [Xinfangfangia sp. CPCC 101601]|uniref:ABC transporter permease n=1 Tax=Pseudogemmobacter lacusdianii TaxID=3069608 RepID=A0ABU0W2J7_9RHOB|nr:ABC transporter permease [Xinfangfangia sp. CPCC 101601]MDQ2067660.1 ABC transporter permease [Xinfangfangia sp. CPCC 101601]
MITEAFRLALRSIIRNKLRSFLTMLGIVIGVASVIAMVTVGQGSSAQVTASVEAMGSDLLVLRPGRREFGPPGAGGRARAFTLRDAEALAQLPEVARIAPIASSSQTVVAGSANAATSITGSTPDWLHVSNSSLAAGRNFTDEEDNAGQAMCLLGQTVRQRLFGQTDPVGQTVRIKSISCQVIGLLQAKGAGSFGQDQDDVVVMPIRLLQRRLAGGSDVSTLQISVSPGTEVAEAMGAIREVMRERRRLTVEQDDDFSLTDMKEIASMLNSVNTVLAGLLSSVAAVSLLVGGIGIMNIMLVSVTERTREIGIRLAVGASARQVLTQFLVESVALSVLGGIIGILTGLLMAWGAGRFMGIPFVIDPLVVVLAFGFSALVGVVFGYFPARRAARMDPIEALRHQ